jgi:hypothetical protein
MTYSEEYIKDRIRELQTLINFELANESLNTFILNQKIVEYDDEITELQSLCPHTQKSPIEKYNNISMIHCISCDKILLMSPGSLED